MQLEPEPELTLVIDWLCAPTPRSARTTLVHGDFKPGNALLEGDRWTAVLDWGNTSATPTRTSGGSPARCVAGSTASPMPGSRVTCSNGGAPGPGGTSTPTLRWWQALANVKLSVIVLTGARAFSEGRLDRVPGAGRIHRLLLDQIGL